MMEYARSYMNATSLVDRIRASAASGKTLKASGGLGSRGVKADSAMSEVPSFDEVRAKYMMMIQDMFPEKPVEIRVEEIKSYLGELQETRPRRNPQTFSTKAVESSLTDRDVLAMTIQAEAGGEGTQGMLAVGAVIDNRLKSGKYGDSVKSVALAPGQFSAWNSVTGYANGEGGIDMTTVTPSSEAYAVADQILSGKYSSPVGNATHYYNPSVANPAWGEKAGGSWTTLGNHVFGYGN